MLQTVLLLVIETLKLLLESKWSQTRNFGPALFKTGIAVTQDQFIRFENKPN